MIKLKEAISMLLDKSKYYKQCAENDEYCAGMTKELRDDFIKNCHEWEDIYKQLSDWLIELDDRRKQVAELQLALDKANEKFKYLGFPEYDYDIDYGRDMIGIYIEAIVEERVRNYQKNSNSIRKLQILKRRSKKLK